MAGDNEGDDSLQAFMQEVKQIEQRDSVLTSKQQIDRLLRPGSTYFNLNPFEVLQLSFEATDEQITKQFRKISFLIHPDKNINDSERAQRSFDALNEAHRILKDEKKKFVAIEVIKTAKEKFDFDLTQKRKEQKKAGFSNDIPEDNQSKYDSELWKATVKMFTDREMERKRKEDRDQETRKREREQEIDKAEEAKKKREADKEWEANREKRMNSWQNWKKGGKGKSLAKKMPKHRSEKRIP